MLSRAPDRRGRRWCGLGLVLFLLAATAGPAQTQARLAEERASLDNLGAFGVVVDVEAPRTLAAHPALAVDALHQQTRAQLRAADAPVLSASAWAQQAGAPYLYLHVNAADAGQGLVPFSIEVQLLQRVRLDRDPAARLMVPTWESEVVGLVSRDQLARIPEAAALLVDEFLAARSTVAGG